MQLTRPEQKSAANNKEKTKVPRAKIEVAWFLSKSQTSMSKKYYLEAKAAFRPCFFNLKLTNVF